MSDKPKLNQPWKQPWKLPEIVDLDYPDIVTEVHLKAIRELTKSGEKTYRLVGKVAW